MLFEQSTCLQVIYVWCLRLCEQLFKLFDIPRCEGCRRIGNARSMLPCRPRGLLIHLECTTFALFALSTYTMFDTMHILPMCTVHPSCLCLKRTIDGLISRVYTFCSFGSCCLFFLLVRFTLDIQLI